MTASQSREPRMNASIQSRRPSVGPRREVVEAGAPPVERTQKLLVAGSVLAALGAASCCVVPFGLFLIGVSGAWIGNLTQLAPYQPYFIAATLACLGYGYWLVYRREKIACAEGACARPLPNHIVKAGLVLATILVAGAIAFDVIAPLLLNS